MNKIFLDKISFCQIFDFNKQGPNAKDNFEVDCKVKRNQNYKDDYDTFKRKLKENLVTTENVGLDEYRTIETEQYQNKPKDNLDEWDQFKSNKEKFNVSSNYEENKYTTELDKSNFSEEVRRKVERIEKVMKSLI